MILSSLVSFSVISTGIPSMIFVYLLIIGSKSRERKKTFDVYFYGIKPIITGIYNVFFKIITFRI